MGSSTKIYNDYEEKLKNVPKHNALYSSNSDFSITSTKTFKSISTPNSERKILNTVSSGATSSNSKEIE